MVNILQTSYSSIDDLVYQFRWKLHEACLLAMGRCKQLLNDMLVTGYVKIDLDSFVRQVPLADLSQFGKENHSFFLIYLFS